MIVEPTMEDLKQQLRQGLELIGRMMKENDNICLRSWVGAFAKAMAYIYEAEGLSHEVFEEEMQIIASEYKYMWEFVIVNDDSYTTFMVMMKNSQGYEKD